ncbi:MAG: uracil-DNA glycosylase [Acidimicrobiia bacterium]|nr:uracil-DNA glycosylase [Acidimicrobiia bacterium]
MANEQHKGGGHGRSTYSAAVEQSSALALIHEEVVSCGACPRLVSWREQVAREKRAAYRDQDYWGRPVPGFGDHGARILIVGLAPAAHGANRTGRVFTGDRSGDFLFAALHRAGLASQPEATGIDDGMALTDVFITAPVKCAPPANKPTPGERSACRPFFQRELAALEEVRVVLVLGAIGYAAAAVELDLTPRPRFGHGLEVDLPDGRSLICSYHVSQQNTFTGRLTEPMFDAVLGRARELAGA